MHVPVSGDSGLPTRWDRLGSVPVFAVALNWPKYVLGSVIGFRQGRKQFRIQTWTAFFPLEMPSFPKSKSCKSSVIPPSANSELVLNIITGLRKHQRSLLRGSRGMPSRLVDVIRSWLEKQLQAKKS